MTSPSSDETAFDFDAERDRVLDAALTHVPFDGWTEAALARGATDCGHEQAMALRLFPRGAIEAVELSSVRADRLMMEELERRDLSTLKIRERIALAVRLRLERSAPHREAIRRAVGVLAMPHNAPLGARLLYRTVDAMWYAAGDTATDFNFYTKRGLLAGVYSATLLYWFDDRSEGFVDTFAFLDRRIGEVMQVPRALGELRKRVESLFPPFGTPRRRQWR